MTQLPEHAGRRVVVLALAIAAGLGVTALAMTAGPTGVDRTTSSVVGAVSVLLHGDVGTVPAAAAPTRRRPGAIADTSPDSGAAQARLVSADDVRLSQLVRGRPATIPYDVPGGRGSLPTLVLTARPQPYGLAELLLLDAVIHQPDGSWLLTRSLLVGKGAELRIQAPGVRLRLVSTPAGFTSVVASGGRVTLAGDATAPLTITSWDPGTRAPDTDESNGRAYIRAAGSRMDLSHLVVTGLGFWSGRTGGISWTGTSHAPATGGATDVVVTKGHYGIFSSRTSGLLLTDTTLRNNDLDGLLVHHGSTGLLARSVTAERNGGDGVDIARGTGDITVEGATAINNVGDGIRINGSPLAAAATAGGGSTARGARFTVRDSTATGNAGVGILAMSADDVLLADNHIGGSPDGIVVRGPAARPTVSGNSVDVAGFGIAVRGGVTEAQVRDNHVNATIGMHVTDSTAAVADNVVTATRYGISLVGHDDDASVTGNTLDGRGLAAVDLARLTPATVADVTGNDSQTFRTERDNVRYTVDYAEHHPVLLLWLLILLVPLLTRLWVRGRPRPAHPYDRAGPTPLVPVPWIYSRAPTSGRGAVRENEAGQVATRLTLVSAGQWT